MGFLGFLSVLGLVSFGLLSIVFLFDVLFRGFAPLISARPWVVKQLVEEIEKIVEKEDLTVISFGSGRSGFLHGIAKRYPAARLLLGVEDHFFAFLVAKFQVLLRKTNIRVRWSHFYEIEVKEADLIYCYFENISFLRSMGRKFKFECRPDTLVISNGFPIPDLEPFKVIEPLPGRERLKILHKGRKLWRSRRKQGQRENKIYFYQLFCRL